MANMRGEIFEKILPDRDTILLAFNEHDAEIARNWQFPAKVKPLIDRPLPLPI